MSRQGIKWVCLRLPPNKAGPKNMFDVLLLRIKTHLRKHRWPTLSGYLLITKAGPPPPIPSPSSHWSLTAPSFFKSRGGHVPVTSYQRPHFSLQAARFRNETFTQRVSQWRHLEEHVWFSFFFFFFCDPESSHILPSGHRLQSLPSSPSTRPLEQREP